MNKLDVLIIEDDRDTAGFFKTVLNLVGFECEVILSAKEALARLAGTTPDLILLDIRLGLEISGEDILYQIRSNPRFDNTRVVIITAYPHLAEPITDLADLILLKPVDMDQLKNLLQRVGDFELKPRQFLFRDPVTELFNEEFFLTRLDLAFERSKRRPDYHFAVIAIQLQVEAGVEKEPQAEAVLEILRQVSARLQASIRPTDAAARLSGWKFATLYEDLRQPEDLKIVLERLREKLAAPYQAGDESLTLQVRLQGIFHDPSYRLPSDILKAAEKALEELADK